MILALLLQLAVADGTHVATPSARSPMPRDSAQLAQVAIATGIPVLVFEGAAIAESGLRGGNEAVGPGRLGPGGERLCREVGRLQVNPCADWTRLTPACRHLTNYSSNLQCGAAILRYNYDRCAINGDPSWSCAVRAYNGRGPLAERHVRRVERIIGQLVLADVPTIPTATAGMMRTRRVKGVY